MKRVVVQLIGKISDGGAESVVRDYALRLNSSNIETIIVTLRESEENSANYSVLVENHIRIIQLIKPNRTSLFLNSVFKKYYRAYKLWKIIKKEKASVVHGHLSVLDTMQPLVSRFNKTKFFYTCHSEPSVVFGDKNQLRAGKKTAGLRNFHFIALHEVMKNEIDTLFKINNTIVLKNGVDFQKFSAKNDIFKREILGIPRDAFVVGHVGRFSPVKNHLFLLEIFTELKKIIPKSFLLMIGSGELYDRIQEEIKKKEIGPCTRVLSHRSDVNELIQTMDCFVFPSKWEGLSMTLIEAQACGVRCVISDSINTANVLSEKTVLVSLQKSPKDWARIIADINIKNSIFQDLQEYNIEKVIERVKDVYFDGWNEEVLCKN